MSGNLLKAAGIVVLLAVPVLSSAAQPVQTSEDLVAAALRTAADACAGADGGEVCYGHIAVITDAAGAFSVPGDRLPLADVRQVQTAPINPATGEWGLALITQAAGNPGAALLLVGDVAVADAAAGDPLSAFHLQTGFDDPQYAAAPNALVLQTAAGAPHTFTINGAALHLDGIAVLTATPGQLLDVLVVQGGAEVGTDAGRVDVPAGRVTTVPLGGAEGFAPVGPPAAPAPFPLARVQHIPFQLLPEPPVRVRSEGPGVCAVFGGQISAGQVVLLEKTIGLWNSAEDAQNAIAGIPPVFVLDGGEQLGAVRYFGALPEPSSFYGDLAYTAWIAAPGDHTFTVIQPQLNRAPETCTFTVAPAPTAAPEACTLTAINDLNRRVGPGTAFNLLGPTAAGEIIGGTAQAVAGEGALWWRLADGAWVRADLMATAGPCDSLPLVNAAPPPGTADVRLCTLTTVGAINRRLGPDVEFPPLGQLEAGQSVIPTGYTIDLEGARWWQLSDGTWIRADLIAMSGACATIPQAVPPTPSP